MARGLIRVKVAAELAAEFFTPWPKHRAVKCLSGLPPGAELREASVKWDGSGWALVIGFEADVDAAQGHEQEINPSFEEMNMDRLLALDAADVAKGRG